MDCDRADACAGTIVISALRARAKFGELLRRVEEEPTSLITEKRCTPRAVLLSIRGLCEACRTGDRSLKADCCRNE
jgi:prevent-host-death family protein